MSDREFAQGVAVSLGDVDLRVFRAGHVDGADGRGLEAAVEVHNGRLKDADRVILDRADLRRAKVPWVARVAGVDDATADRALLDLIPLVEAALRASDDAPPRAREGQPAETRETSDTAVVAWPDPPADEAYVGLAGDFVRAIELHTEADPVAILTQLIVGFGNLVGRGPHFLVGASRHTVNEDLALVGATAKGRKGTSESDVRALLRAADETWERERIWSGLSSGEGLIFAVRDKILRHEPIKEHGRVVGYQDVEVDPGVSDKRLLVIEPEFASVLRVLARDGSTLSATMRQAWDSGNLRTMTKNSPVQATGAHISIVGHITRDELLRYLSDTEAGNGFANRILWIAVRRARYLPDGGALDMETLDPLVYRLRQAVDTARRTGQMTRDDEARDIWHRVYQPLSDGQPGLLGAMTARAEAHVLRLSMLYALLDCSAVIRRPHLEAALGLWEYAENSARWIFGQRLGDATADEILDLLRAHPEGISRTALRDVFGRHKSSGEIARALGTLVQASKARSTSTATGGRPEERWFAR